jgi:D-alanyl-D-alanine carboxypeptidase
MRVARALPSSLVLAVVVSLVGVGGTAAVETGVERSPFQALIGALVRSAATVPVAEAVVPSRARLPVCRVKDKPTRYGKVREWRKTLLDTNLRLQRRYMPWDLVNVSRAGIPGIAKVRKVMIDDLRAMAEAARDAGKPLAVRSAYRSFDTQRAIFDREVRRVGTRNALKFVARPGHSEHQLGLTIDFTRASGGALNVSFGASPAGKWLARRGWRYGFVLSYPRGKRKATCYGYEPWHWRYVGRDLARLMHESGQVPRRYLWQNLETAP